MQIELDRKNGTLPILAIKMTAIIITKENFGKKVEYLYKKVLSQPKGIKLYTDTPTNQKIPKVKLE